MANTVKVMALRARVKTLLSGESSDFSGVSTNHIVAKAAFLDAAAFEKFRTALAKANVVEPVWIERYLTLRGWGEVLTKTVTQQQQEASDDVDALAYIADVAAKGIGTKFVLRRIPVDVVVDYLRTTTDEVGFNKMGDSFPLNPADKLVGDMHWDMNVISKTVRSMVHFGHISGATGATFIKSAHDRIESLQASFAGKLSQGRKELVFEDVVLRTKHGQFDDMRSDSIAAEWDDLSDSYEDDDMFENRYEVEQSMAHATSQSDSVAEDEGIFKTALHDEWSVLMLEPEQLVAPSRSYSYGAVFGLAWPTDHPAWEDLLERVATKAITAKEFVPAEVKTLVRRGKVKSDEAKDDIKARQAAIDEKADGRLMVASQPMADNAPRVMWVLNSLTRTLWRDRNVLSRRLADLMDRLDKLEERRFKEEKRYVPTVILRHTDERSEPRETYAPWAGVIKEEEGFEECTRTLRFVESKSSVHCPNPGDEFRQVVEFTHTEDNDKTQYGVDLRWFSKQYDAIEGALSRVLSLESTLLALQSRLAPLWAMNDEKMPAVAPVYWNQKGPHLTEAAALAALSVEMDEIKAKARMKKNDALEEALAEFEENFGAFMG